MTEFWTELVLRTRAFHVHSTSIPECLLRLRQGPQGMKGNIDTVLYEPTLNGGGTGVRTK